jgi:hypothetical protein
VAGFFDGQGRSHGAAQLGQDAFAGQLGLHEKSVAARVALKQEHPNQGGEHKQAKDAGQLEGVVGNPRAGSAKKRWHTPFHYNRWRQACQSQTCSSSTGLLV